MRVNAQLQDTVLRLLLPHREMSIRQLTNLGPLSYHQVASCLTALMSKGYVKRVRGGIYEVTEEARLTQLSPEIQIKALKQRVTELENIINSLITRISKSEA